MNLFRAFPTRLTVVGGMMAVSLMALAGEASWIPGQTFRDCPDCPQMTVVPAGSVSLGDPKDFDDMGPEAPPRPKATIPRPFAIGTFEVTQAEWEAVMHVNPSEPKGGHLPVVKVSWRMVQNFVDRLNAKTGRTYRLPSEVEWEYAARAGSGASYSFGEDISELGRFAWIEPNSDGVIHPVGTLQSNAFGLYDMHGNAWEWTADCYTSNYAKLLSKKDIDAFNGFCYRVIRGGSVLNFAKYATAFSRASLTQVNNSPNLGFRLVLNLP